MTVKTLHNINAFSYLYSVFKLGERSMHLLIKNIPAYHTLIFKIIYKSLSLRGLQRVLLF